MIAHEPRFTITALFSVPSPCCLPPNRCLMPLAFRLLPS